jgi:hypothetical protein
MTVCRSLEIPLTTFCCICDKRLSGECYATLGLSCDENDEVKFYLKRREGRFWLQVPEPVGWLEVTDYVDSEPLVNEPIHYE